MLPSVRTPLHAGSNVGISENLQCNKHCNGPPITTTSAHSMRATELNEFHLISSMRHVKEDHRLEEQAHANRLRPAGCAQRLTTRTSTWQLAGVVISALHSGHACRSIFVTISRRQSPWNAWPQRRRRQGRNAESPPSSQHKAHASPQLGSTTGREPTKARPRSRPRAAGACSLPAPGPQARLDSSGRASRRACRGAGGSSACPRRDRGRASRSCRTYEMLRSMADERRSEVAGASTTHLEAMGSCTGAMLSKPNVFLVGDSSCTKLLAET